MLRGRLGINNKSESKELIMKVKLKWMFRIRFLLIKIQYCIDSNLGLKSYEKLIEDINENSDRFIKVITKK